MAPTGRQQEAITRHDLSMVVTAGAGTGKTFVLVEKYLDLIEKQGLCLREILALTFTDKAATEMKERIRGTIANRIENDPDNRIWKDASEEVFIAPIMTFHSFCSQILREFAIEAGLDPGFVILDGGQSAAIRKEAFETLLKKPPVEIHDLLVRVLAQVERFRLNEMLSAISENYENFQIFSSRLRDDPGSLIHEWQKFITDVREPVIKEFFADKEIIEAKSDFIRYRKMYAGKDDSAVRYLEQVCPFLTDITEDASRDDLATAVTGFLSVRPQGKIGSQKIWEKEDLACFRNAKSYLVRKLERVSPYLSLNLDPQSSFTQATLAFYMDLAQIADQYMEGVNRLKKQVSGLDFGDLIQHTRKFLHENQDMVAKHIRPRYRYIFVDEYQDTDPVQFDIITAIIGDLSPDMNALFIVGDPKQSIYLFRNADVTRFKEAQERILSECQGRLIDLDTSFRSSREVIGFVNYLFGSIFASSKKAWEFGYEPINICEERRSSQGSIQILFPNKAPSGSLTSDHKEIEAGMVADLVHRIVSCQDYMVTDRNGETRPAGYGDIAILLERRTHLAQYMDALMRNDTPFYVHGGIGFYTRQEIYDLFNILSFLLRPYDNAALYGLLRSPYFSLSDTTLFKIMCMKGVPRGSTLLDRIRRYPDDPGVIRAVNLLDRWLECAGREPVLLLINRILRESGVLTVYGALPMGEQQVANLDKLIQITRGKTQGGIYELSDLVNEIAISIDEEEREGEAALDSLSKTSVNIMTVHAAKGLEFPVVILPDMGSSREGKQPSILSGDSPLHVGVKIPNPDNEYEIEGTPVYQALSLIRREKETAERKRLFYVGTTRARDHLILCGKQPDKFYDSVDESNNRIDWICTLFGISKGHFESGESIWFDPKDGGEKIEIRIIVDPDQMTREWAGVQLPVLVPPEEYSQCSGQWKQDHEQEPIPRRVMSLSEIMRKDPDIQDLPSGSFTLPDCDSLGADEIGTILHRIFAGKEAGIVLSEYGIHSAAAIEWCRNTYETFLHQPEMQHVSEQYCELSFVLSLGEYVIDGRMDRLCRNTEGWMVIDYKSGMGKGVDLQLNVYRLAAEELLGQPVRMYLYSISSGELIRLEEIPDEEMRTRIGMVWAS